MNRLEVLGVCNWSAAQIMEDPERVREAMRRMRAVIGSCERIMDQLRADSQQARRDELRAREDLADELRRKAWEGASDD